MIARHLSPGRALPAVLGALIAVWIGIGAAQAQSGDAAPELSVDLQSEAFALLADSLLLRGNRDRALVAALKGLPDDPVAPDFERFEAAHLMLYRAMAARVLRLPIDAPGFATLGPQGRRMVVGGPQPALYAMPEGRQIARLLDGAGAGFELGDAPAFSPDGRLLAVVENRRPVLHVFEAETGAHQISVTLPSRPLEFYEGFSSILLSVGFSVDGSRFAVETIDNLFVLDTGDWRVADYPALGVPHWLPDGRLLLVDFPAAPDPAPGTPLLDLRLRDGAEVVPLFSIVAQADAMALPPDRVRVNQSGTALLALSGGEGFVFDGAGELRAILPEGVADHARFVRGGTALALPNIGGGLRDAITVVSLTGAEVGTDFADFALFDRGLFNLSGSYLGLGPTDGPTARYEAVDVPRGRALWEAAMASLGDAARAEVAAERIVLP